MTGLVNIVRKKADKRCLVAGKLKKEGCSVSLKDAPESRVIIDFDKPGSPISQNDSKCDYLFVADEEEIGWIVPIELKKGKLDSSKVIKQLKAGAKVAESWVSAQVSVNFRPIVVFGATHRAQIDSLKKNKIKFHKKYEVIRTMKCGRALKGVL